MVGLMGKLKTFVIIGIVLFIVNAYFNNQYANNHHPIQLSDEGKILLSKLNNNQLESIKPLANDLKGDTIVESVWNIILWENKHIHYNYDKLHRNNELLSYEEYEKYIQYPSDTLAKKSGVCVDYAVLTAGLLLDMGYDPYIIMVDDIRSAQSGHSFCAVNIDGKIYALDQHPPIERLDHHIETLTLEGTILPDIKRIKFYYFWKENNTIKCMEGMLPNYWDSNDTSTLVDYKSIENDITNYFQNKYGYTIDYNINNMENKEYLPEGYKSGVYIHNEISHLYPIFGTYYGKWLDEAYSEEGKDYYINFKKYNRIFTKIKHKNNTYCIYIYLAKK